MKKLFDEAVQEATDWLSAKEANRPALNIPAKLYAPFSEAELTEAIRLRLMPEDFQPELKLVFLPCTMLRSCIPGHTGDWYFTGDYPTPGGYRVVNQALVNAAHHLSIRAY